MTDMIEKVARAICAADEHYGGWPYEKRVEEKRDGLGGREILFNEAKAAIQAHEKALEAKGLVIVPREPTNAMADKGENALIFAKDVEPPSDVPSGTWWAAIQCYQAMLAALEGKE